MTNITSILVTYEDSSTYTVNTKLTPDVQGVSVEDLQKEQTDLAAVEADVTAEIVEVTPAEPVVEAPVTPAE